MFCNHVAPLLVSTLENLGFFSVSEPFIFILCHCLCVFSYKCPLGNENKKVFTSDRVWCEFVEVEGLSGAGTSVQVHCGVVGSCSRGGQI